jgi:hypothetical protein
MAPPKKPLPLPAVLRNAAKINIIEHMRTVSAAKTAEQKDIKDAAEAAKKEG